jgi:hypothetical protein
MFSAGKENDKVGWHTPCFHFLWFRAGYCKPVLEPQQLLCVIKPEKTCVCVCVCVFKSLEKLCFLFLICLLNDTLGRLQVLQRTRKMCLYRLKITPLITTDIVRFPSHHARNKIRTKLSATVNKSISTMDTLTLWYTCKRNCGLPLQGWQ